MAKSVQKPFRLHTRSGVIAMSGQMFDLIAGDVVRCNGAYAPRRDYGDRVMKILADAAHEQPEHFTETGRSVLSVVLYDAVAA